jgi:hypothetical protein
MGWGVLWGEEREKREREPSPEEVRRWELWDSENVTS